MVEYLKAAMIDELGLDEDTVARVVEWQETEGVLDYSVMREIYPSD